MSDERSESPLPLPQPCPKPVQYSMYTIKLKSLRQERNIMKSLTPRINFGRSSAEKISLDFKNSDISDLTNEATRRVVSKQTSIIGQAKAKGKKTNTPRVIPHKEINLIRKAFHQTKNKSEILTKYN